MKLKRFRVQKFRSIEDSEWVETCDITALIGINEAGKSNLMLPLWKLNPARDGEVDPLADYPRKDYARFESLKEKPVFIEAEFDLEGTTLTDVRERTGRKVEEVSVVRVSRRYGSPNALAISFPNAEGLPTCDASPLLANLREAMNAAEEKQGSGRAFEVRRASVLEAGEDILHRLEENGVCTKAHLEQIQGIVAEVPLPKSAASEGWIGKFLKVGERAKAMQSELPLLDPAKVGGVEALILRAMPKFVYYSSYGNLDSEIYLPHVVANMKREDLGPKEC